jgi:hypothetical protein
MVPSDDQQPSKDEPPPQPTRSEEARRIIEEYAADLREIMGNRDYFLNKPYGVG